MFTHFCVWGCCSGAILIVIIKLPCFIARQFSCCLLSRFIVIFIGRSCWWTGCFAHTRWSCSWTPFTTSGLFGFSCPSSFGGRVNFSVRLDWALFSSRGWLGSAFRFLMTGGWPCGRRHFPLRWIVFAAIMPVVGRFSIGFEAGLFTVYRCWSVGRFMPGTSEQSASMSISLVFLWTNSPDWTHSTSWSASQSIVAFISIFSLVISFLYRKILFYALMISTCRMFIGVIAWVISFIFVSGWSFGPGLSIVRWFIWYISLGLSFIFVNGLGFVAIVRIVVVTLGHVAVSTHVVPEVVSWATHSPDP